MPVIEQTRLLKALGGFDLAVTAWLAIPGLADLFIRFLDVAGTGAGIAEPLPSFPPLAMFLVNLAGVLGVCWNWALLRTASYDMYRINRLARLFVAALIVYYVTLRGVTPVILLFAITEIFGSWVEYRIRVPVAA